ncbi:MAG: class F sortase [Chloroflexi bacterium]|nr:class F sortase [Chloroflexota bacterium]
MTFFTEASLTRKAVLLLGGLAFFGGLGLIAVAGLSTFSGESESEPDIELRDLGETPIVIIQSETPAPATDTGTPTPVPEPPLRQGAYTMIIDTLGVNAQVDTYGLDQNAVPEVPTGPGAAEVVAWYNFSAEPGTGSNAVFAGHVTWFGPGVFFSLTSVTNGDEIKLVGQDGTELTYVVNDVFQVDAYDPDSLQVMRATDEDVITIITCDGDFVDTGDPVYGGEYPYRLVVRAALAETLPGAVNAGG